MRITMGLRSALQQDLPVLFVYIGWAHYYDGIEPIKGNFFWVKEHPNENTEAEAFIKNERGVYSCGIGKGHVTEKIHVVFVAKDPADEKMKVVGIYPAATTEVTGTWSIASTKHALLLRIGRRPAVTRAEWAGNTGMRRWAHRGETDGPAYPGLYNLFQNISTAVLNGAEVLASAEVYDEELSLLEGEPRKHFVAHRNREAKLRRAKIRAALSANRGSLICEVPKCGFDFSKHYGELGLGYAQVHHLKPLSQMSPKGTQVSLKDLAIVCANCHAMIHLGGKCRPMNDLIQSR